METAAAILTKLVFEHNDSLKSQLNAFNADKPEDVEKVIVPVFRQMLSAITQGRPSPSSERPAGA